jgi:16S rRNA (guanine1516-N2)-methyltransferase
MSALRAPRGFLAGEDRPSVHACVQCGAIHRVASPGRAELHFPRNVGADAIAANPRQELVVDFVGGAVGYRFRWGGGRGQALPKAAGFTSRNTPSVVDATAGLGRDAFLLASMGSHVTLVERSPEVHALLRDGLARASAAGPEFAAVVARMTLLHGDAKSLLPGLQADVVIVDPMHPPRENSALVKKEMRLLRQLVGTDPDALELMQVAFASARQRVVLKWPLHAHAMEGLRQPSHQIVGKTTRYDVFMIEPAVNQQGPRRQSPLQHRAAKKSPGNRRG